MSTNRTIMSVYYDDKLLFCTDSFPAIPEVGESISMRRDDEFESYVVTDRNFIYQTFSGKNDREIFVIIYVRKPESND